MLGAAADVLVLRCQVQQAIANVASGVASRPGWAVAVGIPETRRVAKRTLDAVEGRNPRAWQ